MSRKLPKNHAQSQGPQRGQLSIIKTREYVWRCQFGGELHDFGWINCWHVVNERGEVVEGGHTGGSNVQSGNAVIARKRDAQAFIDGYYAMRSGLIPVIENGRGKFADADRASLDYLRSKSLPTHDNAAEWFKHGAFAAMEHGANKAAA